MNIVVGKLGKKFYVKKEKWTIQSGDQEVIATLVVLAYMNRDVNFYVLGKSDISDLTEAEYDEYFPNHNVIDIWKDFSIKDYAIEDMYKFPVDWFESHNIHIDFGYIHAGPISSVNVHNHSTSIRNPENKCITTAMANRYAGPMIHYLNISNIPYVVLGEDPRYFPLVARDLYNRPLKYLSSVDDQKEVRYNPSYLTLDEIRKTEYIVNVDYDRLFLVLEDPSKLYDYKKHTKQHMIDVYTNKGTPQLAKKKLEIFSEYIFKYFDDSKIFGYWDEEAAGPYINRVENIPMIEMNDRLYKTKYTLMVSYNNKSGPSSKLWKMVWFGIIPFCHPNYDIGINQPVHPFLRVKNGKEFYEKICKLESDPTLFNEILQYQSELLNDSYFNGEFVNKVFHTIIKEYMDVVLPPSSLPIGKFVKESTLLNGSKMNFKEKEKPVSDIFDLF